MTSGNFNFVLPPYIRSQTWAFNLRDQSLILTHHLSNGEEIPVRLTPEFVQWYSHPPRPYHVDLFQQGHHPRMMIAITLPSDRLEIHRLEACLDSIPLQAEVMTCSMYMEIDRFAMTHAVLRIPYNSLDCTTETGTMDHFVVASVLVDRPIRQRQVLSLGDGILPHSPEMLVPAFMAANMEGLGIKVELVDPIAKICRSCQFYHGRRHNGNFLVCAVHPYGNGETCSDFEPKETQ